MEGAQAHQEQQLAAHDSEASELAELLRSQQLECEGLKSKLAVLNDDLQSMTQRLLQQVCCA